MVGTRLLTLLAIAAASTAWGSNASLEAVEMSGAARHYFDLLASDTCPFRSWLFLRNGSPITSAFDMALFACENGFDTQAMQLVTRHGLDIKAREYALLRAACAADRTDLAYLFLAQGTDENAPLDDLLAMAAAHGNLGLTSRFIAMGADAGEGAPLTAAAAGGHLLTVKLLISRGARPRANFGAALIAAAGGGHHATLAHLLTIGGNARARNCGALRAASAGGHGEIVALLLDLACGENVAILNGAMAAASLAGHGELAPLFEARGASWAAIYDRDSSVAALASGPLEVLQHANAAGLLGPSRCGLVFADAAPRGRLDIVNFLIGKFEPTSSLVIPALCQAILDGHAGVVEATLVAYSTILTPDDYTTLLIHAVEAGPAAMISHFVSMGGTLEGADVGGLVQAIAKRGTLWRMQWLIEHGFAIEAHVQGAMVPAIEGGSVEMVNFLLERGAILDDSNARECFISANKSSQVATLRFLMERFPAYNFNYGRCFKNALENGSVEMLRFIRSNGFTFAHVTDVVIRLVIEKGSVDVIRFLISVEGSMAASSSAIFKAAMRHGYSEVARFLLDLDKGAHFDHLMSLIPAGKRRYSILSQWADALLELSGDIDLDLCDLFVGVTMHSTLNAMKGALPYVSNDVRHGCMTRALIAGASMRSFKSEKLIFLLENGADAAASNSQAAFNAASVGSLPILRGLLANGAEIGSRANEAFVAAASSDNVPMLEFLLEHGASLEVSGHAALEGATGKRPFAVIAFLNSQGIIAAQYMAAL